MVALYRLPDPNLKAEPQQAAPQQKPVADTGRIRCFMIEQVSEDGKDHRWRNVETGEEYATLESTPLGSMWFAPWMVHEIDPKEKYYGSNEFKSMPEAEKAKGHLIVKTPGGYWDIDQGATHGNGSGWSRTGVPPKVTARPSILFPQDGYHGWLTDGELIRC